MLPRLGAVSRLDGLDSLVSCWERYYYLLLVPTEDWLIVVLQQSQFLYHLWLREVAVFIGYIGGGMQVVYTLGSACLRDQLLASHVAVHLWVYRNALHLTWCVRSTPESSLTGHERAWLSALVILQTFCCEVLRRTGRSCWESWTFGDDLFGSKLVLFVELHLLRESLRPNTLLLARFWHGRNPA